MDAADRKEQAAKCRRLASYLSAGDLARERLLKLAEEYESGIDPFDGERHHENPLGVDNRSR
jgi:hypothetical protein